MKKINEMIPEGVRKYVGVSLEFRHRFEYRENFDFNRGRDDQDGFHLIRTRLNVEVKPVKWVRGYLQLQDARIYEEKYVKESGNRDDIDVRQAYVDIKPLGDERVVMRVGRQELRYGKERILGGFNWSNVAQSFDAVRVMVGEEEMWGHVFAARKVKTSGWGWMNGMTKMG